MIAFLHSRGGFDLVLGVIAVIAFGFVSARVRGAAGQRRRARRPGRSRRNSVTTAAAQFLDVRAGRSCTISAIRVRWQFLSRS